MERTSFWEDVEGDPRWGRIFLTAFAAIFAFISIFGLLDDSKKFQASLTESDRVHIQQMRIELSIYLPPGSALELKDGSVVAFIHRDLKYPKDLVLARWDGTTYVINIDVDRQVYDVLRIVRPSDPDYNARKKEFIKRQLGR